MPTRALSKMAMASFLTISACAFGQNIPRGFLVPNDTISPDQLYGVTVPIFDELKDSDAAKNSVIELKTGRVLAEIQAWTGWDHMNHGGVLPSRWSKDGSLLLWEVEGKWFPWALVVLKIEKGEVKWQTDILKAAQQAILARTKKAAPIKFASVKKDHGGWGSAYPDGFTVDVEALDPISLPLNIRATLTSDPKVPERMADLNAHLNAIINERGELIVTGFGLTRGPSRNF